jgi:hypothetical protein
MAGLRCWRDSQGRIPGATRQGWADLRPLRPEELALPQLPPPMRTVISRGSALVQSDCSLTREQVQPSGGGFLPPLKRGVSAATNKEGILYEHGRPSPAQQASLADPPP